MRSQQDIHTKKHVELDCKFGSRVKSHTPLVEFRHIGYLSNKIVEMLQSLSSNRKVEAKKRL
jgi:hypothetical protein